VNVALTLLWTNHDRERWWQRLGGHLLRLLNQELIIATLFAGIYYTDRQLFRSLITQLPCGCIFKAISPLPFCCRPLSVRRDHWRIFDIYCIYAQSFWYYARIYLRGLLLPRNWFVIHLAHWVSVKSVVAVLMIVLLLWGLKGILQRDILLHLCLDS